MQMGAVRATNGWWSYDFPVREGIRVKKTFDRNGSCFVKLFRFLMAGGRSALLTSGTADRLLVSDFEHRPWGRRRGEKEVQDKDCNILARRMWFTTKKHTYTHTHKQQQLCHFCTFGPSTSFSSTPPAPEHWSIVWKQGGERRLWGGVGDVGAHLANCKLGLCDTFP